MKDRATNAIATMPIANASGAAGARRLHHESDVEGCGNGRGNDGERQADGFRQDSSAMPNSS